MFEWLHRKIDMAGSVLFRGTLPPRAENLSYLEKHGVIMTRGEANAEASWCLELDHPTWGKATAVALRDVAPPSSLIVDMCPYLSDAERDLARAADSMVTLRFTGGHGNVLRDRKNALRYLAAVMGEDGLMVMDHVAQRFWSREALEDELAHDADVDIESLYALHWVYEKDSHDAHWAHTHGLGEIGLVDIDVLNPAYELGNRCSDLFRALAFAVAEEALRIDGDPFRLVSDVGVDVTLVSVPRFLAAHPADSFPLWRKEVDEHHRERRGIVCDGSPPGLVRRLFGGGRRPAPCRFLSRELPDDMLVRFSDGATDLMAARARATVPVLRALAEELSVLKAVPVVKIGYRVDGGAGDEREHLWFEVHAFTDTHVDATLSNQPYNIARMKSGQRGLHPLDALTDWTIFTPAGSVTPRTQRAARVCRENRDTILAALEKGEEEIPER